MCHKNHIKRRICRHLSWPSTIKSILSRVLMSQYWIPHTWYFLFDQNALLTAPDSTRRCISSCRCRSYSSYSCCENISCSSRPCQPSSRSNSDLRVCSINSSMLYKKRISSFVTRLYVSPKNFTTVNS